MTHLPIYVKIHLLMKTLYNIYLVGFMGTGKTSVGRALSKRLRLKFVDMDESIVKKEKRSINDIFDTEGEPYFRKVEKEALKEVADRVAQVVACGGGIVIDPENIEVMKKTGKIIALTARPQAILERTKKYTHRPLLNVAEPEAKIEELLRIRRPYYAKADFSIDTSDLSVKQVAQSIVRLLS